MMLVTFVGQIVNLFAMCAGRTGGRMKIALPHVLRFSTGCGRLSRVRRIANPPAATQDKLPAAISSAPPIMGHRGPKSGRLLLKPQRLPYDFWATPAQTPRAAELRKFRERLSTCSPLVRVPVPARAPSPFVNDHSSFRAPQKKRRVQFKTIQTRPKR